MVIQPAPFPALGIDCVTVLDATSAAALKAQGISFAIRYLGSVTASELEAILDAGLLASVVTYADQFDGPSTIRELTALGIPEGVTVWLDVESVHEDAQTLIASINNWASHVSALGWQPGLYVGANQPLTGEQLYQLRVVRYWKSMSQVTEPSCGWSMVQAYKTTTIAGTQVDVDYVTYDYQSRLPMMVSA